MISSNLLIRLKVNFSEKIAGLLQSASLIFSYICKDMLHINVIDPSCLTDLSPQERNLSTSQHLDQGIIRFLKAKYRTKIVQKRSKHLKKFLLFHLYFSLKEWINWCVHGIT